VGWARARSRLRYVDECEYDKRRSVVVVIAWMHGPAPTYLPSRALEGLIRAINQVTREQ
jgi:hypothetical protein